MTVIDLRSDTVTVPTPTMVQAMMAAKVGDDVYGEDPAVNHLEEQVADLLGKEAAMFVPTGTMANQIAINLHTRPGQSILAEEDCHVYLYEAGGAAALSGVQFQLVPKEDCSNPDAFARRFKGPDIHYADTGLVVLENTHNRQGGLARTSSQLRSILEQPVLTHIPKHMDGARLWNAAIKHRQSPAELSADFTSLAVCFSKGLGAAVGSALVGPADFIAAARTVRKRFGGGMRQAGYLAAGASYALNHHLARLAEDHHHAASIAALIQDADLPRVTVTYGADSTNMVYVTVPGRSVQLTERMRDRGIIVGAFDQDTVRIVTHLGATAEQCRIVGDVLVAAAHGLAD